MKKFIPILSFTAAFICLQNCIQREDDMNIDNRQPYSINTPVVMQKDSARLPEHILDPDPTDPPVRDGDNWRTSQNTNDN